jgi:hypothetical protein
MAIEPDPTDFTQNRFPETPWSFPWESSGGTQVSYVVRSIRGIVKHNEVLLLDQKVVRLITIFGHEEWQTRGIRVPLPQHYKLHMDASRSDGGNYLVGTRVLAACLGNQVVGLRSV